jgi:uncharacterized membrane protein (UPF0127 family)
VAPVVRCVRNLTRDTELCSRVQVVDRLRDRSRGLLGHRRLGPEEGMLFEAESWLPLMWMHSLFMRFPIDILFLGRGDNVIRIQVSLKPWRLSPIVLGARKALELSEGVVTRSGTALGDFIAIDRQ